MGCSYVSIYVSIVFSICFNIILDDRLILIKSNELIYEPFQYILLVATIVPALPHPTQISRIVVG